MRFLFVLILLAVATYLLVRAFQRRGMIPEASQRQSLGRSLRQSLDSLLPQPKRTVPPDDDDDFLRDLDRKKRQKPDDPDS